MLIAGDAKPAKRWTIQPISWNKESDIISLIILFPFFIISYICKPKP